MAQCWPPSGPELPGLFHTHRLVARRVGRVKSVRLYYARLDMLNCFPCVVFNKAGIECVALPEFNPALSGKTAIYGYHNGLPDGPVNLIMWARNRMPKVAIAMYFPVELDCKHNDCLLWLIDWWCNAAAAGIRFISPAHLPHSRIRLGSLS